MWIGSFYTDSPYGYINVKQKQVAAHRYSYQLNKGEIPEGLHILHECDNPTCVNPDHLRAGTPADNIKDMMNKGRDRVRGEKHGNAKLTYKDAEDIRHKYKWRCPVNGTFGLARQYGVAQRTIMRIIDGSGWKPQ